MKRGLDRKLIGFMVTALMICFLISTPAAAQRTLKFASWAPQQDTMNYAPNLWMKALEERTAGKFKVTPYYSETLGKLGNSLDMLKTGICDLALMPTAALSKHFRVIDVLAVPGVVSNRAVGTEVLYALLERGLLEKEFAGFKAIVLQAHDPFYLNFTKKKVTTLEDLKGMKIRFPSVTTKMLFEAWGATPVSVAPPDLFMSINTGVLDGTSASPGYMVLSKMYEIMKYGMWGNAISSGANIVLMSRKTWDSFPKDVQAIMDDLNAKAKQQYLEAGERQDVDSLKTVKAAGFETYSLSADELRRWEKLAQPVVDFWVSDTEAAGYPGKAAIETARQVVQKFK